MKTNFEFLNRFARILGFHLGRQKTRNQAGEMYAGTSASLFGRNKEIGQATGLSWPGLVSFGLGRNPEPGPTSA